MKMKMNEDENCLKSNLMFFRDMWNGEYGPGRGSEGTACPLNLFIFLFIYISKKRKMKS